MKLKTIIISISCTILFSQTSTQLGGFASFNHISRLSNNSVINIPYRMFNLNINHQHENFSILSTVALEYQLRNDAYFLTDTNPQEFFIDLREFYAAYYGPFYEIRMGKQIHSWGSADENSPLDNAGAYDYYYIFMLGTERKMATLSVTADFFFDNLKLNFVFSPLHTTNRLPLGNDDFPITLPIYPEQDQIFEIRDLPLEYGANATFSSSFGDISLSYFNGYDRIFNLTGVNVYAHGPDLSFPHLDILFGYRKTQVFGIGGVLLHELAILRGDFGFFSTRDMNNTINQENTLNPSWYDSLHFSYPLNEQADYFQTTIQLETELPFGITFIGQFFKYDTLSYAADTLPVSQQISIPNLNIDPEDMTPANFFTPGMGAPLAILSKNIGLIILEKTFINEQAKLTSTTILDFGPDKAIGKLFGSLTEIKFEYSIEENLIGAVSVTKVSGDDSHPDGEQYQFNKMEDFSHYRFELKYFF